MICFLFYITLMNLHNSYVYNLIGGKSSGIWQNSFYNLSIALFYMAFSVALQLSKEWFFQREQLRLMEIEKLNAELEYLKLQINPHFLFNSLNTIYFQIEKTNGLARDTLLKFSDLLRYPLYECNGKEVKLEKELQYLRNYFDLQRLRKEEHYNVTFDCAISDGHQTLAPLLLVPFVENAFKHVSHFSDRPNEIRISISRKLKDLEMKVFNTKDDSIEKKTGAGGIGLKNVRRRLEIMYGKDFSLEVRESVHAYEIHLKIPLHDT